jgi:hypothetical protein
MKRIFAAFAATLLLASPSCRLHAYAADVHAVLAKPIERVQTADYRATGHLVRVDAAGKRTSLPITLMAHWFPGVLRVLCEINASGQTAGSTRVHILLEMRPGGRDSIQIAHPGDKAPNALPFERWGDAVAEVAGPVFSYEDFLEGQYFWSGQTVTGETKYGARDCDLLKSTPGPSDRSHYAEIRTFLDRGIGYPVYVEKTLKTKGTIKEFTYFGLRQVGGVWSASQVEGKIRGQSGSTLLIIDRGVTKANLDLRDFSPEQLTRF